MFKVMASSGHVCIKFIIQHTQYSRLIPIITSNLCTHKNKDIRRSCCEFLEDIFVKWSTHSLERHIALLQEALKKGIADADSDARIISRRLVIIFVDLLIYVISCLLCFMFWDV